jgi:hypothetical protein
MHHGLDHQNIVNDSGHTQQVVISVWAVLVKPAMAGASFLLKARVDNVLYLFKANVAFPGALLRVGREHDLQFIKTIAFRHRSPQKSLNTVTRLKKRIAPATWFPSRSN